MPSPKKLSEDTEPNEHSTGFLDRLPKSLDSGTPKTPQLYALLRNAIVSLDLEPGARINEKEICDRLGVSRTPLREAIQQLSKENLVTVVPNSGTSVSKIDLHDVFDGQFVREALELKCAREMAETRSEAVERELEFNLFKQRRFAEEKNFDQFYRHDEEFHELIASFASSKTVWEVVHQAKAQLDRVRRLAIPTENHLDLVLKEHLAIFDAIKAGNVGAAEKAMADHLGRVYETVRKLTAMHSVYFKDDKEFQEKFLA